MAEKVSVTGIDQDLLWAINKIGVAVIGCYIAPNKGMQAIE